MSMGQSSENGTAAVTANGTSSHSQSDHASQARFHEVDQVYSHTGLWCDPPPPLPTIGSKSDLFVAYNRSYPLRTEHDSFTWLEIRDHGLLSILRTTFPNMSSLYERQPGMDCRDLYVNRRHVEKAASECQNALVVEAVTTLLQYATDKFSWVPAKLEQFPKGAISWHLLWCLFEVGQDIVTGQDTTDETMGIRIDSWHYAQESMGKFFVLKCHYYQWAGTSFHRITCTRKILEFGDLRQVSALQTRPLTPDQRSILENRGRLYLKYAGQVHASYRGSFFTKAFAGSSRLNGDGQVVIDVRNFRRLNPALDVWSDDVNMQSSHNIYHSGSNIVSRPANAISEDQVHLLPPTVHGFSLRAKRWGEFLIDRLFPIVWLDRSFEHLVIPNTYRKIIKSLVSVHASDLKEQIVSDVIEGKGNGLIIALYGSPGTGKTLTAEAVAEHLRRPLYTVSAGELGLTPNILEKQLKDLLELATLWGAVLLIDEADIFLEQRDTRHLERNALVGIFLRLLEYFSGVLILTTNRLERFDEAFMSRFAIALHFKELSDESRKTLWSRFLTLAGADPGHFDLDFLAAPRLNGRMIKHAVQTAQALSLMAGEGLGMRHCREVLEVANLG